MSVRSKKLIAIVAGSVIFVFLMTMIGLFTLMAVTENAPLAVIGLVVMAAVGSVVGIRESRLAKARKAAKRASHEAV